MKYYTEEELKAIQEQLVENTRLALEAAKKRGYKVDPRIEIAIINGQLK